MKIATCWTAHGVMAAFISPLHCCKQNPMYEGIIELCEKLKANGIKMAVATYKREDYALTLPKHFGFPKYCNPMHGADNNNVLKNEDIVRMCQAEMGA